MTAETERLTSSFALLAGDLQSTDDAPIEVLKLAQLLIYKALRQQIEPIARPEVMAAITAPTLDVFPINSSEVDLSEIEEVLAESTETPEYLVYRRELPVLTTQTPASLPSWATGRAIERTLGPFQDSLGRPIWIDLFRIVRQVSLVRSLGGAPFLSLPVQGLFLSGSHFTLGAGSLWFASKQLAPDAPIGGYTGLCIKGGTLTFSQAISATGTQVLIPPGVACTVQLLLEPPEKPTATSDPGADARVADAVLPAEVTLVFSAGGATVQSVSDALLTAYGTNTQLSLDSGVPQFVADLNRIFVPFKSKISEFTIRDRRSVLFMPEGTAAIEGAAWALPVAMVSPTALGDASGAGVLALQLKPGLTASWKGQPEQLALGNCILMVEPERLALVTLKAKGFGAKQAIKLWNPETPDISESESNITFPNTFSLRFIAQAVGIEALLVDGQLVTNLDRPLTVDGSRVPLQSQQALVYFVQLATGTAVQILALLVPPKDNRKAMAFAVANAVLKTSPTYGLAALGLYDGQRITQGVLILSFRLQVLLPTLPDPYAANYTALQSSLQRSGNVGTLYARIDWVPDIPTKLSFVISTAQTTPEPTPQRLSTLTSSGDRVGTEKQTAISILLQPNELTFATTAASSLAQTEQTRDGGFILLDVSTNADWLGVRLGSLGGKNLAAGRQASTNLTTLSVDEMYLQVPATFMQVLTVPEVQWEPVYTPVPNKDDPTFPTLMSFPDSGGPSLLAAETVELVRVAPNPALDQLILFFNRETDSRSVISRFTLPFGIVANALLRKPQPDRPQGAALNYNRPLFSTEDLMGGRQVSIQALGTSLLAGGTPGLEGSTVQLRNGLGSPAGKSILGDSVDTIFNDNFQPGGTRSQVPVTRIDLSGYGESTFSDWRNPSDAAAVVSQARFDVIVGRTAFEVIQVQSLLYPYAVRVVRTITIHRQNSGTVVRSDSGWQAATEGHYRYPDYTINPDINPSPGLKTHPGVVQGARNLRNIRETGENFKTSKYGTVLMAVRFDADIEIEGVIKGGTAAGVPARSQLGFVQLTDPQKIGLLDPEEYAELISKYGTLGGAVDCLIDVGGSRQLMRVTRVGVGVTPGMGTPEFVMTAWGSPLFPGGGQWSFLRQTVPGDAPQPIDRDLGVPLIRAGAVPVGASPFEPYRFADPGDLARPDSPNSDYGILHATGTQRIFFPRPKIETSGATQRITSTQIPVLADPYILATAVGFFPPTAKGIPFPNNNWALAIAPDGNYRLELPSATFPVNIGQRTIADATSVRSYADYAGAIAEVAIDTAAPIPWRFRLKGVDLAMSAGNLGEIIRIKGTMDASATLSTQLNDSAIKLGGAFELVEDIMAFLKSLGAPIPFNVFMTNKFKLKHTLQVPKLDDILNALLPPKGPKFGDAKLGVFTTITAASSEMEFEIGAVLFIPTPFDPLKAVGLLNFKIKVSTASGNTYTLTWGVGVGVEFKILGFGCKAYYVQTQFLIEGATTFGLGAGLLIKGSIDLKIVTVDISLEAKMAILKVTCPDVTIWGAAKVTFAIEITIAWVIEIDFKAESEFDQNLSGGPCALPDVL